MGKLTIEFTQGKEVVVSERNATGHRHRFNAMSINMNTDEGLKNIAMIMRELSVSGNWLVWGLIMARDYNTNLAELVMKGYCSADKQRAVRGYSELKAMGLVLKKGKSVFMINPEFIMPNFNNYDACQAQWLALKAKGVKDHE